jgi:hypothetical protein
MKKEKNRKEYLLFALLIHASYIIRLKYNYLLNWVGWSFQENNGTTNW